jgi:hypothetical protein
MPKEIYSTDASGITRINPCKSMVINGKICGAGTIIKLENKPVSKEVVTDG